MFFDVDGTLPNKNPGCIVPNSTYKTLEKLKENRHFIAIVTGRSYDAVKKICQNDKYS